MAASLLQARRWGRARDLRSEIAQKKIIQQKSSQQVFLFRIGDQQAAVDVRNSFGVMRIYPLDD